MAVEEVAIKVGRVEWWWCWWVAAYDFFFCVCVVTHLLEREDGLADVRAGAGRPAGGVRRLRHHLDHHAAPARRLQAPLRKGTPPRRAAL
jgi:hypothetical protein